jgi:hypothetical protein
MRRRNLLERALTMEGDRPLQRIVGGPRFASHTYEPYFRYQQDNSVASFTISEVPLFLVTPLQFGPPTFLVFREINFMLAL